MLEFVASEFLSCMGSKVSGLTKPQTAWLYVAIVKSVIACWSDQVHKKCVHKFTRFSQLFCIFPWAHLFFCSVHWSAFGWIVFWWYWSYDGDWNYQQFCVVMFFWSFEIAETNPEGNSGRTSRPRPFIALPPLPARILKRLWAGIGTRLRQWELTANLKSWVNAYAVVLLTIV